MSRAGYSLGARLLHHMALGSTALAEVSFDLDQALCGAARPDCTEGRHVFVAGLARAGTTILMRRLFRSGVFHSLTYRDMPFVLAPNLWRRLESLGSRDIAAVERAHGDGLLVDFDSPEALEEVFWRVICGDEYLWEDRLVPMAASPDTLEKFRRYVAALLREQPEKRYLSKNNNNILRLPDLVRAFPKAAIVIPFRAPIAQATSLMQQHQHFIGPEQNSGFTRRYMGWLAHHEFGPGHRPFVLNGVKPQGDPNGDLNYWLQIWTAVYGFVLEQAPAQAVFLSYERLCGATEQVWPTLCDRLGLPDTAATEPLRAPRPVDVPGVDRSLLQQATALHRTLLEQAD